VGGKERKMGFILGSLEYYRHSMLLCLHYICDNDLARRAEEKARKKEKLVV